MRAPSPISRSPAGRLVAIAALGLALTVQADQSLGNDPYQEKDPGFFHRASNSVGNFFKRVFRTDEEQNVPPPTKAPAKRRSREPRYNLDRPPSELRSSQPDSTREIPEDPPSPTFEPSSTPAPPPTAAPKETATGKSKGKSASGVSSRGTTFLEEPPKTKSKPPASRTTETESSPAVVPTETTSRSKTKKHTETPTASTDPGTVLYSNTGSTGPKSHPESPAKVETENNPPPPNAPSDASSVMTGTKTGKSGRVKSPYAPYSELDVTGLPSGSLALDPTTQKVFRIP